MYMTEPQNDGRNFCEPRRWAIMPAQPLCWGQAARYTEKGYSKSRCAHCSCDKAKCIMHGNELRRWASDAKRLEQLVRIYASENQDLRKLCERLGVSILGLHSAAEKRDVKLAHAERRATVSEQSEMAIRNAVITGSEKRLFEMLEEERDALRSRVDALNSRVDALEWVREVEALEHAGWMNWHPSGWRLAAQPETKEYRMRNHVLRVVLKNEGLAMAEFDAILAAARAAVEGKQP